MKVYAVYRDNKYDTDSEFLEDFIFVSKELAEKQVEKLYKEKEEYNKRNYNSLNFFIEELDVKES